ncbi:hypothetical protein ACJX0J_011472, partial [Zea mays]
RCTSSQSLKSPDVENGGRPGPGDACNLGEFQASIHDESMLNNGGCLIGSAQILMMRNILAVVGIDCTKKDDGTTVAYNLDAFVYTGLGTNLDEEAQKRTNDEYLFAIGHNYYDNVPHIIITELELIMFCQWGIISSEFAIFDNLHTFLIISVNHALQYGMRYYMFHYCYLQSHFALIILNMGTRMDFDTLELIRMLKNKGVLITVTGTVIHAMMPQPWYAPSFYKFFHPFFYLVRILHLIFIFM